MGGEHAANPGGDDTDTTETVMLRMEDGAWYELKRVDAEQQAALELAAVAAGTDEVAGFHHYGEATVSGTLWIFTSQGVIKLAPDPSGHLNTTLTVGFASRPSGGFPGFTVGR